VIQVKPDSPADQSGIAERDVIVQVNQHAINSMEEFVAEMNRGMKNETILLRVLRDGYARFIPLKTRP